MTVNDRLKVCAKDSQDAVNSQMAADCNTLTRTEERVRMLKQETSPSPSPDLNPNLKPNPNADPTEERLVAVLTRPEPEPEL